MAGALKSSTAGMQTAFVVPWWVLNMRADRVAHGVDRAKPLLEGGGPHRRRAHHLGAGFDVGSIKHRRAADSP